MAWLPPVDGPIQIPAKQTAAGRVTSWRHGLHLNLPAANYTADLAPYRLYPDTPHRIFAGDEPPYTNTVFLRFMSEREARLTSLARYWRHDDSESAEPVNVVRSSSWTGKRTLAEQCEIVRQVAPVAMVGLEQLADHFEHRWHNRQLSPNEQDALDSLKRLHRDLGELLRMADCDGAGAGAGVALDALRRFAGRTFEVAGDAYELSIRGVPPILAAAPLAWGVVKALEVISGQSLDLTGTSTVVAAVAGGTLTMADKLRS